MMFNEWNFVDRFKSAVDAASVPKRSEPMTGELHDARSFEHLNALGYKVSWAASFASQAFQHDLDLLFS
jgi:hydroxypyruvate isomerase